MGRLARDGARSRDQLVLTGAALVAARRGDALSPSAAAPRRAQEVAAGATQMGEAACYTIQGYTPPDVPLCPARLSARTLHGAARTHGPLCSSVCVCTVAPCGA